MSTPCEMDSACRNSIANCGEALSKCAICRLSPDNTGRDMSHSWSSLIKHKKHPQLEKEKRFAKSARHFANLLQKRNRDTTKRKVSRQAAAAEKTTEKNIIRATKNSGRRNKDGDHVSANMITLDTKLQTTRDNPVIYLSELEKVCEDAKRAGKEIGGLVVRNKYNVGCVVLREDDYSKLIAKLLKEENVNKPEVGSQIPGDGKASSFVV